jgi:pyruvate,orthophosphate dikinase
MATQKRVWLFEEGNASMRDLLGGKGANLSEMSNIGLPVPPGFTITTEVCNDYYAAGQTTPAGVMDEVNEALARVEAGWARNSATPPTRCCFPCAPGPSSRCPA